MGVAALVIGIVALIFSIIPFLGALAIYLAIPGVLLGIGQIVWPKKKKGLAIAGLILGLIAGGISFAQYQMTKAAASGLQSISNDLEDQQKRIDAEAQARQEASAKQLAEFERVRKANQSAPAVAKPTPAIAQSTATVASKPAPAAKTEPLKLHGVYRFQNDGARVFVVEFENLTGKAVTVFRGNILYCDDFGKPAKQQKVTYKETIPAKGRLVIATLQQGRQVQTITADSMDSLKNKLPLPYSDIKVQEEIKFKTTDIRYVE